MEIYAHFAMYNAVSLSAAAGSKPYSQKKYQYQIDFKWPAVFGDDTFE